MKPQPIDTRRMYGDGIRVIDGAYTYTRGDGAITTISLDNTTREIQKYVANSHPYRVLEPHPTKRKSGGDPLMRNKTLPVHRTGEVVKSGQTPTPPSHTLSVLNRPKDCGCGKKREANKIELCGATIKQLFSVGSVRKRSA